MLILVATLTSLLSCSDDDKQAELISAIYPSSVELVLPDNLQELVYVDKATKVNVLPLVKGEKSALQYYMTPENVTFNEVEWTSNNMNVVMVDSEGVVEATGEGYAVVQVAPIASYSGSGINSTIRIVVVNALIPAKSVELFSSSSEVFEGESLQLSATILPENATYRTLRWSSSDENVATVDRHGVVTGIKADNGSATVTITATTLDGSDILATQEVTIIEMIQPQSVEIDQKYAADKGYECATADKTITLDYTTVPANSTTSMLEWKSDNEDVATVKNGVVTFNQKGIFGKVTITATCPETGYSSSIMLDLAEGLIRELFHDENNYSWYNAKQSGNGTSSSHIWEYGKLTVTTYAQNPTTQRADFKCWSPKTWLHAGKYPIIAIRMEDVKDKYKNEGVTARNISIDSSGSCNGEDFKGNLGGNNAWLHDYKCNDGSHVFIYDLTKQTFSTGGLLPTSSVASFNTFQFKYADIKSINHQIEYSVYWVQTFKTLEDLQKYINSEGLTYEVIK